MSVEEQATTGVKTDETQTPDTPSQSTPVDQGAVQSTPVDQQATQDAPPAPASEQPTAEQSPTDQTGPVTQTDSSSMQSESTEVDSAPQAAAGESPQPAVTVPSEPTTTPAEPIAAQAVATESAPTESAPTETAPTEATPAEAAPTQTPVQAETASATDQSQPAQSASPPAQGKDQGQDQNAPTAPAANVSEETSTSEPAVTSPEATPVTPRKVQLNPTSDPAASKAVPSLASSDSPNAAGTPVSAQQTPPSAPVDIPKAENLDEDLESQLNAALAVGPSTAATGPALPKDDSELEAGMKLKGTVDSIDDENIIVDIGYRSSGVLNKRHFEGKELPKLKDKLRVVVETVNTAEGVVSLGLLQSTHRSGGDWNSLAVGQLIECTVQKTNKGGLEIQVSQLRGFMPAGQVDLGFVGDLEPYVGQKLTAKVIDINPKKRNLIVSRKAVLMEQREELAKAAWETLTVGEQRTGTVKTIKDYGAFVDIGGIDGLLHVRELSWTRVNHPSDVIKEGEQIDVKVLTIDQENKKISLGMKQLMTNPWDHAEAKFPKNTVITGQVKKITDFGAFVEIEPGLEGLIHISELDFRRVNRVQEILTEGQEIQAQVLEINKNKKRISLSIKALKPKPQPSAEEVAAKAAADAEARQFQQEAEKRRKTLKGGTGGDKAGGLFGNPSDF